MMDVFVFKDILLVSMNDFLKRFHYEVVGKTLYITK